MFPALEESMNAKQSWRKALQPARNEAVNLHHRDAELRSEAG